MSDSDDVWVDMNDDPSDTNAAQPAPAEATQTSRRRNAGRSAYAASPSRRQFIIPGSPTPVKRSRRGRQAPELEVTPQPQTTTLPTPKRPAYKPVFTLTREELVHGFGQGMRFTARHSLDVFKRVVILSKTPLSFILLAYILVLLLARLSHLILSPFCVIPGISSLAICRPADVSGGLRVNSTSKGPNHVPQWADYPGLVDVQSTTFEQLLGQATGGLGLSLEIKKAEMATADLVTLVRVSDLRSRELLANTLSTFVHDARMTGRGLQRLNAKMGGAVDKYVYTIYTRI
jgi:hypothetical protein